ncbi:hypothetical protein CYY_001380 [Polysphondylium violaceum]|uniref:Ubiquitin-like domain-containing protein n=1 Tax=Polysphondylium violaceum TaxID=133409 RepID=A0A8J4Q1Y7_9MYCE|nr:hypothetical protein CYY_001380 [Polysphondylium violaceum]
MTSPFIVDSSGGGVGGGSNSFINSNNTNNNNQMQASSTFVLRIINSQNGHVYKIPANPAIVVDDIKNTLSQMTNIPKSDQRLLTNDANLNSVRNLASYNIYQDREFFLFDRPNSKKPDEEPVKTSEIIASQIPQKPQPKGFKDYETTANPINRLFGIEFLLENQLSAITYIKDAYEKNHGYCYNIQKEIENQLRAIDFLTSFSNDYKKKVTHYTKNIIGEFQNTLPNYESLLNSFDLDMNRLRQIRLHDCFKRPNQSLADCVDEKSHRDWNNDFQSSLNHLKGKALEVENNLQKTTEVDVNRVPESIQQIKNNLGQIQTVKEHYIAVHTQYQYFFKNHQDSKRALEQIRSNNDGSNVNQISTILLKFLEIKNAQANTLKEIMANQDVARITNSFFKLKNFVNHQVWEQVQIVAMLEDRIFSVNTKVLLFKEAFYSQIEKSAQLKYIRNLPTAYESSLTEIASRKEFGSTINNTLGKFSDTLKNIRDKEAQRRKKFSEQTYPSELFYFLKDQLPNLTLTLHPPKFDERLPNINNIDNSDHKRISSGSGGIGSSLSNYNNQNQINNSNYNNNYQNNNYNFNSSNSNHSNNSNNSNNSNSNNSNNDIEEEFTVVDDNKLNVQVQEDYESKKKSTQIQQQQQQQQFEKSVSELNLNESLQIKTLESKNKTAFNLVSKLSVYKDLCESQQQQLTQLGVVSKELEEKKQEIVNLTEKIANLILENKETEKLNTTLESAQLELESKIASYLAKLEESDKVIDQLNQSLQQLKDQQTLELAKKDEIITQLQADIVAKEQEINEAQDMINRHEDFIKISTNDTNDSKIQLESVSLEKEKLALEKEKLATKVKEQEELHKKAYALKEEEVKNLAIAMSQLQDELCELRASLQESFEKHEQLAKEREIESEQVVTLRSELDSHVKSISEKEQEIKLYKDQIDQSFKEKESNQEFNKEQLAKIQVYQSKIETLELDHKTSIDEINQLKEKQANLLDKISQLEIEVDASRSTMNTKQSESLESQKQLGLLEHELAKFKELFENLKQEKQKTVDQLESSQLDNKSHRESFENEIKEKNNEIKLLKNALNDSSIDSNRQREKISQLEEEIQSLRSTLQTLYNQLETEQNEYQANFKSKDTIISMLNAQIEQMNTEASNTKEDSAVTDRLNAEIKDLQSHLSHLQTLLTKSENLSNQNQKESEQNKQKCDKLARDKIELLNEVESKSSEISHLFDEIKSLKHTLLQISKNVGLSNTSNEMNDYSMLIQEVAKYPIVQDNCSMLEHALEQNTSYVQELKKKISQLESTQVEMFLSKEKEVSASLSNFTSGSTALFCKNHNDVYEAVNIGCPNYFLSRDSFEIFKNEMTKGIPILGIIFEINSEKISSPSDSYGVPPGTRIHEVTLGKHFE